MNEKILIAGADEAGRGAVIGPLVIAGVSLERGKEKKLVSMGVKDSKLLAPQKRDKLAKEIEKLAKDIIVIRTNPCKIDTYRKEGIDLNRLEAMKFADVVNFLEPAEAYIDGPDPNLDRLKRFLQKMIRNNASLTVEHYADSKYPVVSAASIIAKVERDREIVELRKKYGEFGSGYPSDTKTTDFLKKWFEKNKEYPECVRKTWLTAEDIAAASLQQKIGKWFKSLGTRQPHNI